MFILIIGFLFVLNILNAFKEREYKLIPFIFLIFLFLTFAYASSDISDYPVYEIYYNTPDFTIEPGFSLLEKLSNNLGFTFEQFRILIAATGFFILFLAVKRITKRYSYFLSIYFLFPFFFDVIQIRNFLMMVCVFYGATFLIRGSWKDVFYSVIWILIAGSIHLLGYLFLIGVLLWMINKRYDKSINIIIVAIIVLSILLVIPEMRESISSIATQFADSSTGRLSHLLKYSSISVRYGFVIGWIRVLSSFLLVYWVRTVIFQKMKGAAGEVNTLVKKINMLYSFVSVSLIALPLLLIDADFERIFRDVFFMVICAGSLVRLRDFKSPLKRYLFILLLIVVVGLNVYGVIDGTSLGDRNNIHLILFNNTLIR